MTVQQSKSNTDIRLPLTSADALGERMERLRELFPEAFVEGQIDFDRLRNALGDFVGEGRERYGLSWAGKADAIRAIQAPSVGTLVPCPEESVNFDTTENMFIEGDNLEVLKLLQKSYYGKVKMIYIDPPYNTGNEFIYPDNFREGLDEYLRYSGQVGEGGVKLSTNTETSGRYHSKWLSMMYPRLFLARNLLRRDGVILVSIDDHEGHNLRLLLNEVFGEESYVGTVVWKGATDNNPTQIAIEHEYVYCYARDKTAIASEWKNHSTDAKELILTEYRRLLSVKGNEPELIQEHLRRYIRTHREILVPITHYDRVDQRGVYTGSRKVHNPKPGGYEYDVEHPNTGQTCVPPANGYRYPKPRMDELISQGRILFADDETQIIQIKEYLEDYRGKLSSVIHLDSRAGSNELRRLFGRSKVFPNPKPSVFLRELFDFVLEDGDMMLDFFAGSGSSAHAVLDLNRTYGGNRRFLVVQLPEAVEDEEFSSIAEICKERIRRVINEKADSTEQNLPFTQDEGLDEGFRVFSLSSSNFKIWDGTDEPSPEDLQEQLQLFADHVLPDRGEQDILYELMLKAGLPLTATISDRNVAGQKVHSIAEGLLAICLANPVSQECLRGIIELEPQRVICLDTAFGGNDQLKTNTVLEMKSHGIEFRTV
jgi:adenine-specific DNA-methyltransferase